jgi:hypothetical protein
LKPRAEKLVSGKSSALSILISVAFILAATFTAVHGQSQSTSTATSQTAAQKYKNIQVLKAIPADELIPAMQFISASLGVECDFCHVQREFEKDDKK